MQIDRLFCYRHYSRGYCIVMCIIWQCVQYKLILEASDKVKKTSTPIAVEGGASIS